MLYVRTSTICLLLVYFVSAAGCHCFDSHFLKYDIIYFGVPNLLGSIATGIYVISMEDAKLQNVIVEPVFFFCALQSRGHCQ